MEVQPLISPSERWRSYVVCVLGWLFDFYDLILFAYLAKSIGTEFSWGADLHRNKALLVGLALATSGVGGIVFGGLADRFGRRRVMSWTILVYSLSTGLCGVSGGLASLAFFRALTGFGVGGEWATGHALMAEIFPKERRGVASSLLQLGEPVGVALAVLAGLWLEPRLGWRNIFFLSALPAFLVLLVRSQVSESPLWLAERVRGVPGFLQQYKTLLRDHGWHAFQGWLLGSSKMGTYWLVYVWLPEYFAELFGSETLSESFSAFRLKFILLAQGGQLLGMLFFGFLADRFGRRPVFTTYSLLTAGGIFVLARFGVELLAHPLWFWPVLLVIGVGSGCTAGFGALLAELFPTSIRNTAMGSVYNLARASQFITQFIMGIVVTRAGVSQGLYIAMALALVTASWIWTFPETKGIRLE